MKHSKEELLQTRERIDMALYSIEITEGIKAMGINDTKSVREGICNIIKMQFDYEEKWGECEEINLMFNGVNKVLDLLNKYDNDVSTL